MKTQRTILITGVSRGLGLALAKEFISLGHRVHGSVRNMSPELQSLGASAKLRELDVRDAEAIQEWAQDLEDAASLPDLLINNAGVINEPRPLWEVGEDEFREVLEVNVLGIHLMLRAFLPKLIRRGPGVVVNFSSGWGRSTSPEVAPYCASKWAVEGLSAAVAQEVPLGLAVCAVNPGIIDTDMLRSCFGESATSYPNPENWAKTACARLLLLDEHSNGRALNI